MTEQYDVIVIGAGLGGLATAACLAKARKRVLVLEHHSVPGGYAHEFRRGKYRFEVALHALDGASPGGWGYDALRATGVYDRLHLHRMDPFYRLPRPWTGDRRRRRYCRLRKRVDSAFSAPRGRHPRALRRFVARLSADPPPATGPVGGPNHRRTDPGPLSRRPGGDGPNPGRFRRQLRGRSGGLGRLQRAMGLLRAAANAAQRRHLSPGVGILPSVRRLLPRGRLYGPLPRWRR